MSRKKGWIERVFGGSGSREPTTDPGFAGVGALGRLVAAGGTDVGRQRATNEDAFLCAPERGLLVVADGMGGEASGEEASRIAIEALGEQLSPQNIEQSLATDGGLRNLLHTALQSANDAVLSAAAGAGRGGMGSTAVIAVYRQGMAHIANLGDSRAYVIRRGKASLVTHDHSRAALLMEHGQLTPEQARSHPLRNELTAALGGKDTVNPHYVAVPLDVGDRLVLCSDGMWDMVADEEIARLAETQAHPAAAVEALIEAANRAGGLDNITSIVAVVEAPVAEEAEEEALEAVTAVRHIEVERA